MRLIISVFILFTLIGCKHPESVDYERNKKSPTLADEKNYTPLTANLKTDSTEYKVQPEKFEQPVIEENSIDMESINGVKYVWVEINGLRLKFIFDTGASSISISPAEATVLYRQGTLTKEDILDTEYFQDATGYISEGTVVNLRTVKVGNLELENIRATVVNNEEAPLLLGQSVFERFGKIEIDNANGKIVFK